MGGELVATPLKLAQRSVLQSYNIRSSK